LKHEAERAKIHLSSSTQPWRRPIDYLCEDAAGRRVQFRPEVQRHEVAKLSEPYIASSIAVCLRLLIDEGLWKDDIERLVVVGGPTLAPYVREQLETELAIPFDRENALDPLTVVARGAAALAAGIERTVKDEKKLPANAVGLGKS
jgi:molecular chaperone DnaK